MPKRERPRSFHLRELASASLGFELDDAFWRAVGVRHPEAGCDLGSLTMETIRRQPNMATDEQLREYLNWQNSNPSEGSSYQYFAYPQKSPEDELDLEPAVVAEHYRSLTEFIIANSALIPNRREGSTTLEPSRQEELAQSLNSYRQRLKQQSELFEATIASDYQPNFREMDEDFPLNRLYLPSQSGQRDICLGHRGIGSDVLSTIRQRGSFVVYQNPAFLHSEVELWPNYYFSFNPRLSCLLEVAQQLVDLAKDSDLPLSLQILNRADYAARTPADFGGIRLDGLLMYVTQPHVEQSLKLIGDCYLLKTEAFAGRATTAFSTALRPGIGLATTEDLRSPVETLIMHRSSVFYEAYWRFLESKNGHLEMNPSNEDVGEFRSTLETVLSEAGVDLGNISFPARRR